MPSHACAVQWGGRELLHSDAPDFELEMAALQAGADGAIAKCAPDELVRVVDRWMGRGERRED